MPEYIGRYRIIEQIGKGAMARVYKAHDPQINRTLVIKVLRTERCIDKEYRKRFLRESRAAGKLSHPNIVTVFDVGEHQEQPYIVMELLPGVALDTLMKSSIKLSHEQIYAIAVQLARSLDYAHGCGIVHRDIKPSNIVCNLDDNGDIELKLTDFGIAHIEDSNLTQHTQAGDVLGTPLYMSPEQVQGKRIDGRSDLFSLGIILYQLFTGQKPFKGSSIATVLHKISNQDPEPINCLVENVPEALQHIIHRLLEKNPDKRYQTGKELVQTLSAWRNSVDMARSPEYNGSFRAALAPRHRLVLSVGTGLLTLVMFISAYFLLQQDLSDNRASQYQAVGQTIRAVLNHELAEPLLEEDWTAIELFSDELARQHGLAYLSVSDHSGIIRGHSIKQQIGKTSPTGHRHNQAETQESWHFISAVRYRDKSVGQIEFRLSQELFQQPPGTRHAATILLGLLSSLVTAILAFILSGRGSKSVSHEHLAPAPSGLHDEPESIVTDAQSDPAYLADTLSEEQTLAK